MRRELSIPADAFVVVAMARFLAEKGLDLLVDAITRLRERLPDVQLVIAGESHSAGSTRAALIQQIDRCDLRSAVHLPGFVADVRRLLGAADAVVVPSAFEAFGMVALEALASGVPLVSTELGELREVIADIDHPAACALRVPSRNPDDFADTLAVIHDRRDRVAEMVRRGRQLVRPRYSAGAMARAFAALYSELTSAR
jgi:glycosyltransferase involved in cell wall biosynthesis